MSAFLAAWSEVVAGGAALVDAALDVDPVGGSSVAWDEACTTLGVARVPQAARQPACHSRQQTRGVPLEEANQALDAFVATRRAALLSTLTPAQRVVAEAGLGTLLEHAKAQFAMRSTEPVTRGLFKHAKAAASKHQYGTSSRTEAYVLACPSCGGPRQTEALTCVFCGGDL